MQAAEILGNAGYQVSVATVDVSLRETVQTLVERAASHASRPCIRGAFCM